MDYGENIIFTLDDLDIFIYLKNSKNINPTIKQQLNNSIINQNGHRGWQSFIFRTTTKAKTHEIIQNNKPKKQREHTGWKSFIFGTRGETHDLENKPEYNPRYGIPSKETIYGIFSKTSTISNTTYNGLKKGGTSIYTYMTSKNNETDKSISSYQLQQSLNAVIHGGFALYKLFKNYSPSTERIQEKLSDITDSGFAIYRMCINSTYNSSAVFQLFKGGCTLYEIYFDKTLFNRNTLYGYYMKITNVETILNQYKWYTERRFTKDELLKYEHLMGTGIVLINVLAIPYPDMVTVGILFKSADVLYRTFTNEKYK